MSEAKSINPATPSKPERPPGDCTLFWHQSGRWCKKIRGRLVYFGRGAYQDAIKLYDDQKDKLHSGRKPRDDDSEELTVYLLCAKFLTTKKLRASTGDIAQRTFDDYAATCNLVIKAFGKTRLVSDLGTDDFEKLYARMSKRWGLVRLGNEVNRVRIIFRYAYEQKLIHDRVAFGEAFKRPSRKALRKLRDSKGERIFEADELRRILAAAGQPIRTMFLLAINCGYGNSDVAKLPIKALDLDNGWATFPRPKTAVRRRCPLWPETVAAIREWLTVRPEPKDESDAGLVFITKYGQGWDIENRSLSNETRKLLDSLDINGNRNFYTLRHTFMTQCDEAGDFVVTRRLMGHVRDDDMGDAYRERVSDERLRKVTEHVRTWLFGKEKPCTSN
jgi:integrase